MIDLDNNTEQNSGVPACPAGMSVEEYYDRNKKLVFLVDTSGSMKNRILAPVHFSQIRWPKSAEFMQAVRERWENAQDRIDNGTRITVELSSLEEYSEWETVPGEEDEEEPTFVQVVRRKHKDLQDDPQYDLLWLQTLTYTEPQLKLFIADNCLWGEFGYETLDYERGVEKIEIVRTTVQNLIAERLQKSTDADIELVGFDSDATHFQVDPTNKYALLTYVANLPADGWSTYHNKGLDFAIKLCELKPSTVQKHHFVMVTDGISDAQIDFELVYAPQFQRLNIVLDLIHITGARAFAADSAIARSANSLRRLCEATGGVYTTVNKATDLANRVIEQSKRPLLLTAGDQ